MIVINVKNLTKLLIKTTKIYKLLGTYIVFFIKIICGYRVIAMPRPLKQTNIYFEIPNPGRLPNLWGSIPGVRVMLWAQAYSYGMGGGG